MRMLSRFSHVQVFRDPMDCNPPGSSVHGILQAWILEWIAIFYSRGSSWTQGLNLRLLNLLYGQEGSSPLAPPGKAGMKITHLDKGHLLKSLKSNRNSNFLIFNLANKYFL